MNTIVVGKNTYVDEAQKIEHEIMIEKLEKYFEAKEFYKEFRVLNEIIFFPESAKQNFPAVSESVWFSQETTASKFKQVYPDKWTVIEIIPFEKGVL